MAALGITIRFSVPLTDLSYAGSPTLAFAIATVIGLIGTMYFSLFGREFEAYE